MSKAQQVDGYTSAADGSVPGRGAEVLAPCMERVLCDTKPFSLGRNQQELLLNGPLPVEYRSHCKGDNKHSAQELGTISAADGAEVGGRALSAHLLQKQFSGKEPESLPIVHVKVQ